MTIAVAVATLVGALSLGFGSSPAGAAAWATDGRGGYGTTGLYCDWKNNNVQFHSTIQSRTDGWSNNPLNYQWGLNLFHNVAVRYEFRPAGTTTWMPVTVFYNQNGVRTRYPNSGWLTTEIAWSGEYSAAEMMPWAPFSNGWFEFRAAYAWQTTSGFKYSSYDYAGVCGL
jgi:hypothetical protein